MQLYGKKKNAGDYLGQHRTIASASLRRLFAPLLPFEKSEIHTGFETVEKGLCPFSTKGLQSAARTICTPLAYKSHTCSLSCIFCQVHAPTENDQNPFAACGRQTLRGFSAIYGKIGTVSLPILPLPRRQGGFAGQGSRESLRKILPSGSCDERCTCRAVRPRCRPEGQRASALLPESAKGFSGPGTCP